MQGFYLFPAIFLAPIIPRMGFYGLKHKAFSIIQDTLIGSFVVDNTTGRIYAVQFNTICGITSNFLEEQLVGLSLLSDMEEMRERIMTRYLGDSRKAIIVILRDAAAKLRERQVLA